MEVIKMRDNKILDMKFLTIMVILTSVLISNSAYSQDVHEVCFAYFTGPNCYNCPETDSYIYDTIIPGHNNIVVMVFDIGNPAHDAIMDQYVTNYGIYKRIPTVVFGKYDFFVTMDDIAMGLEKRIDYFSERQGNRCPISDGSSVPSSNLGPGATGKIEGNPGVYIDTEEGNTEEVDESVEEPITENPIEQVSHAVEKGLEKISGSTGIDANILMIVIIAVVIIVIIAIALKVTGKI
jgi:hypothetical protein